MTTLRTIEMNCPCCHNTFQSTVWLTTNALGQRSTDFYQRAVGFQSLPLEIHTCTSCGYSGSEQDFEDIEIDTRLRELIKKNLTPLLKTGMLPAGRKYELAAWIALWQGSSWVAIGDLYLKASWCANDEHLEEEQDYRQQAIECFKKALEQQEVPVDAIGTYTYLIGELYRRVGDLGNAAQWFEQVEHVVGKDKDKEWLVHLAWEQQHNPKEFF